jgi:hypothetical protein
MLMDSQLLYTFLSLAASRDTPSGRIVPVEGMKLTSALAHRHGIPVTWIIDSYSVQESRSTILQGHQECGDDVILLIDISRVLEDSGTTPASKAEEIVVLRQKLPEFVISERETVKEILPWAEVNVIAADVKTEILVEVLEELDCIGLWGYRWGGEFGQADRGRRRRSEEAREQGSESPFFPDGCPWSFFYASRNHYDAPAQSPGGLVAVESVSLDLNAVFYSGNSRVFSTNPSALRMSGLCVSGAAYQPVHTEPAGGRFYDAVEIPPDPPLQRGGTRRRFLEGGELGDTFSEGGTNSQDIDYGKALLDEYLKNCSWNRFVIFLQQQPACEMEYAGYDEYDKGTISDIADILNGFFREAASNQEIQPLTLPQAVQLYRREFEYTESCYMAFDSIVPPHVDIDFYVTPVPKQKPPYPFAFLYYDRECQLIFKEGQMTPIEMRNYIHPPFESKYYVEKEMPSISYFRPARDRDKLIMEFEIESIKQMPFGLVIWDDHSMFSLVSTNARLVKWVGNYLLFIRMDLEEGLNRVEVSLTI